MNETKGAAGYSLRPTFGALSIVLAVVAIYFVLALFGGIPGGFLPPSFGGQVPSNTPQPERVTQTQVTVTPSATKEPPSQTPTPTVTNTPTITPTPTLIPRPWTREEYDEFMWGTRKTGENGLWGRVLVYNGWYLYDGNDVFDGFPCISHSCPLGDPNNNLARQMINDAYDQNNNANFWCDWFYRGVVNHFMDVGWGYGSGSTEFYFDPLLKDNFGNPEHEPYCPQFGGTYEDFLSYYTQPTPTPFPAQSLGWTEVQRKMIEQKYLLPILENYWDWVPGDNINWHNGDWQDEGYIQRIPDNEVCWIIANGHFYYGWYPQYAPPRNQHDQSGWRSLRLKLRERLNNELGKSVEGNPPLCPGFLDMIEPAGLP